MEEGEKLGTLLELEKCFGTVLMIPYYLDVNGSIHGPTSQKISRHTSFESTIQQNK